MEKGNGATSYAGFLNTLAQNETKDLQEPSESCAMAVFGKGSDLSKKAALNSKAKRKLITQFLCKSMIEVAEKKGETKRLQTYWNSFHCQESMTGSNGRSYGKYCKNRMCTVCSAIRKAKMINLYMPVISTWERPQFLTLTVKSISERNLKKYVSGMNRALRRITSKHRKRGQRGTGQKLKGIKSLECNFNPQTKKYNPHFHIIVPNKQTAEILITEWLKLWTGGRTNRKAQFYRPVRSTKADLMETIKYGSKIFTEPDLNKKAQGDGERVIYAAALYNIFEAMHRERIFDRFGFNVPKVIEQKQEMQFLKGEIDTWEYDREHKDWVNLETGTLFSGYIPPEELMNLLINSIDTELA